MDYNCYFLSWTHCERSLEVLTPILHYNLLIFLLGVLSGTLGLEIFLPWQFYVAELLNP